MLQTYKHIRQFAVLYLICFAGFFIWNLSFGLTFSQIRPVFFYNQLDLTGNIILFTNIHLYLLQSQVCRVIVDLIYFTLPIVTTILVIRQSRFQTPAAIVLVLFNIMYAYCFSITSSVSIKIMLAYMVVPFALTFKKPKNFFLAVESIRLLFILFFFSTALWKIRAGGIVNIDQMSGILLNQHNYLLVNNQLGLFTQMTSYLIEHTGLAYSLYFAATMAEIIFVIGLFTKKYDRFLIILFLLFSGTNYLLMQINYFSWLPFLVCMYFAKFTTREESEIPEHLFSPINDHDNGKS